jgi:hypothetical protein
MQSGNLAVMGFWDRGRMNEVWKTAVEDAGLQGAKEDVLARFREVSAESLLALPSLQVSVELVEACVEVDVTPDG